MTMPARITQDDMDRAMKAVVRSEVERARVVFDLENQRIEIIIGEPLPPAPATENPWDQI